MMGLITENNKILKMIEELGLSKTIKIFGGFDSFKEITKDFLDLNEDKILFIKFHIQRMLEDWGVENVSVRDLDMNPIKYGISDNQQITDFGPEHVTIEIYVGRNYYDANPAGPYNTRSYNERYENLDDNTIDEIYNNLNKYYAGF
jgi:hypothetical protein